MLLQDPLLYEGNRGERVWSGLEGIINVGILHQQEGVRTTAFSTEVRINRANSSNFDIFQLESKLEKANISRASKRWYKVYILLFRSRNVGFPSSRKVKSFTKITRSKDK